MLKNIAPKGQAATVRDARELRRKMTLPEIIRWRELRTRPGALKFRKQHPSGDYVLDFFCSDARLAIEIDGEAHSRADRPARDEMRDAWFLTTGIATLRIPALEVLRDAGAVVRTTVDAAVARLPLHYPAAPGGPPARGNLGED